ncbi:hypothetical protein ACH4SP_00150 [Streptomyces sp. NPDC021093]|uniref:hypothetical protein n=1 Tax=Streptomyces sp. NPDC021093 TaxID=3365112 RepID=UPI0037AD043F
MSEAVLSLPDPASLLALWEEGGRQPPLERALTLLSAAGPDRAEGARWDTGSRDVLLARLLEGFTGATAWGCAECAGCGAELDVPVDVGALARLPVRAPDEVLRTVVDGVTVTYRLPNTLDMQASCVAGAEPAAVCAALLARCTGDGGHGLPEGLAGAVEAAMGEASPAGAISFAVSCPECGTRSVVALDVAALLWAEVQQRAVALLHEVHALAAAYGWTESDVLALSPVRRACYLELVGR